MQLLQYQKWELMTFYVVLIPPFNLLGFNCQVNLPPGHIHYYNLLFDLEYRVGGQKNT